MKIEPLPFASYGTVICDPPWEMQMYSDKGKQKAPPYPTMKTSEICDLYDHLNLEFCCAPDCAFLIWATFPMLEDAFTVMKRFGFKYKTGGAWHKQTKHGKNAFGTGYIYRGAGELWLVGTRGNPQLKNKSTRNSFNAKLREHSRKPERFYRDTLNLFGGPYLEMFARQTRPGVDAWGLEIDKFGNRPQIAGNEPEEMDFKMLTPRFRKST